MDDLDDCTARFRIGVLGKAGDACGAFAEDLKQLESAHRFAGHASPGDDRRLINGADDGSIEHGSIGVVVLEKVGDLFLEGGIAAAALG